MAIVELKPIWKKEKLLKKWISVLTLTWNPDEQILQQAAYQALMDSVFGKASDYAKGLYKINLWHNSQIWKFDHLTADDKAKAKGLDSMAALVRIKHKNLTSQYLHLDLGEKAPDMCILLHPMVIKMPVISIQHFLDLHSEFAFNSIRKSHHKHASELISYLYEVQTIQCKIALSLYEYVRLTDSTEKNKKAAILLTDEAEAIMKAEQIFSYLKASVEKIVIVLGLTFGLKGLEEKKTHKAKTDALAKGIPDKVKETYYFNFITEFVSSESLSELNNYRTGIMHKKGISDLQPHAYTDQKSEDLPLRKILETMISQHSKNTAVLIGVYALLTDELVKLDPPEISPFDIPY